MEPDRAAMVGRYVGVAVLIIGPVFHILLNGPRVVGDFTFWFGLFGWLVAGIVVGAIVYGALRREPSRA